MVSASASCISLAEVVISVKEATSICLLATQKGANPVAAIRMEPVMEILLVMMREFVHVKLMSLVSAQWKISRIRILKIYIHNTTLFHFL